MNRLPAKRTVLILFILLAIPAALFVAVQKPWPMTGTGIQAYNNTEKGSYWEWTNADGNLCGDAWFGPDAKWQVTIDRGWGIEREYQHWRDAASEIEWWCRP